LKSDIKRVLVLGGGGAKGFAHIGAIKALEEAGIEFDCLVGVSIGAVVGSFYVSGYSAGEMEKLALDLNTRKILYLLSPVFPLHGIFSAKRLKEYLEKNLKVKTFEQTLLRFHTIAVDLTKGSIVVFKEGPIIDGIIASMSIPGLFIPFYYKNHPLVDGGLVEYLPVNTVKKLYPKSKILAIDVLRQDYPEFTYNSDIIKADKKNLKLHEVLINSLGYVFNPSFNNKDKKVRVVNIDTRDVAFFEFDRAKILIERGYSSIASNIKPIKKFLSRGLFF